MAEKHCSYCNLQVGERMKYIVHDHKGNITGYREQSIEDEACLEAYKQAGELLIETDQFYSPETHFIKDGVVVEKPQRPSASHEWSMDTKEWILNQEKAWSAVRHQRDILIAATDWMVLPDAPFTESEIVEIKEYRQALRDITEQSDPGNILWPERPEVIK